LPAHRHVAIRHARQSGNVTDKVLFYTLADEPSTPPSYARKSMPPAPRSSNIRKALDEHYRRSINCGPNCQQQAAVSGKSNDAAETFAATRELRTRLEADSSAHKAGLRKNLAAVAWTCKTRSMPEPLSQRQTKAAIDQDVAAT
jgi:hypothetical protein